MKYLLYFVLLSLSFFVNAQSKKTIADTTKKIVFSEIIKVDSSNRFELFKKASKWATNRKFEISEEDALGGKILAKSKLVVYTDKSVLAKPNGDFSYDILIEIKEGKYRYSFSNFVYRYYKPDRNNKYVPTKGTKPMEDTKAPGWSKQWAKNKMQVTDEVTSHIISLKEAMKYVAPKTVVTPKKEEW